MKKDVGFKLFTDSCCDLTEEYVKKCDCEVISLTYRFDGDNNEYADTTGNKEHPITDFYKKIESGIKSKTSGINGENFKNRARNYLKNGLDILVISFSSALSSTYSAFKLAADELMEEFKERKVTVIDSLSASGGLLVYLTAKEIKKNKSLEEVSDFANKTKLQICHYFTVGDLGTFMRSGRLTVTKAFIGNLLQLKPIMHMDDLGRLVPFSKRLGRKSSLITLAQHLDAECIDDTVLGITHGDYLEDANLMKSLMLKNHPNNKEFMFNYVGPVIGSHTGGTVMAIYFLANHR